MNEAADRLIPAYSLINVFPKLMDLPTWMHWWQKVADEYRIRQEQIWFRLWGDMEKKIDQGVAPDCFGRQLVETGYRQKGIDEGQAAFVAGSE